jgi:hypothetical protein
MNGIIINAIDQALNVINAATVAAKYRKSAFEYLRHARMWVAWSGNLAQAAILAAQAEGELEKAAQKFGDLTACAAAVKACGKVRDAIDAVKAAAEAAEDKERRRIVVQPLRGCLSGNNL